MFSFQLWMLSLNNNGILVPMANTVAPGIETIGYIRSRLWQTLPNEMQESYNSEVLKRRIKELEKWLL